MWTKLRGTCSVGIAKDACMLPGDLAALKEAMERAPKDIMKRATVRGNGAAWWRRLHGTIVMVKCWDEKAKKDSVWLMWSE